jgi:hypothetical protein
MGIDFSGARSPLRGGAGAAAATGSRAGLVYGLRPSGSGIAHSLAFGQPAPTAAYNPAAESPVAGVAGGGAGRAAGAYHPSPQQSGPGRGGVGGSVGVQGYSHHASPAGGGLTLHTISAHGSRHGAGSLAMSPADGGGGGGGAWGPHSGRSSQGGGDFTLATLDARGVVEMFVPSDLRSNLPDFALLQPAMAAASDMVDDAGLGGGLGVGLFDY